MPLHMGRVLSMEDDQSSSTATEYRQSFLSPRREDYIPNVVLPKIGTSRPPTNRSFLSSDIDPDTTLKSSEYRLCFENYHPKRPYCFHAQPSHVFDYVPKPITRKTPSQSLVNSSTAKDTEYKERYPNYRSFIPMRELLPPHLSGQANTPSDTQQKREHMSRSQYFHQLVTDNEKFNGGQRIVGISEHRTAFQWPYRFPESRQKPREQEVPATVYPPYSIPRNIYEPLPPIQRTVINVTD